MKFRTNSGSSVFILVAARSAGIPNFSFNGLSKLSFTVVMGVYSFGEFWASTLIHKLVCRPGSCLKLVALCKTRGRN